LMGRILFFILLGVAAWFLVRALTRKREPKAPAVPQQQADGVENMHRCAHCGLNVPASDALAEGGRWYCSEAHRRLGPPEQSDR
jgi:uncharacterized protein